MTTIEHPSLLLLPGLLCDARLWRHQAAGLADVAGVSVADLSGSDSIAELASLALSRAPPGRFALAGLSMGGYVALEIMRQAPERVLALALLDTSARPDTAEATGSRLKLMKLAETNFPQESSGYAITVRMENGSSQTLTQSTSAGLSVGDRVRIDNGSIRRY
ncbi:Alpha/beta hydrolase family protein [compost metagenome]